MLQLLTFAAALDGVNPADATRLAQRIAGTYGAPPVVTVDALPDGWKSPAPLPQGIKILGSTSSASRNSVSLYYDPQDGAAATKAYEAALQGAGFAARAPFHMVTGGFVENDGLDLSTPALFCGNGVAVNVELHAPGDLRVHIARAAGPSPLNPCGITRLAPEDIMGGFGVIPALRVPAGMTVSIEARGGTGGSWTSSGEISQATVSYAAALRGTSSVDALIATFDDQLQHAGWRLDGTSSIKTGGFSAFSKNAGKHAWTSRLLVYRESENGTFHAQIDATGNAQNIPMAKPAPTLPRIPAAITPDQRPAVLQLLRRVTTEGNGYSAVYVQKAPPDFPRSVPLPQGQLIGSVVQIVDTYSGDPGNDSLYYRLGRSALNAYIATLKAGGWTINDDSSLRQQGFVSALGTEELTACKRSAPLLSIMVVPGTNDVTVGLARENNVLGCRTMPVPGMANVTLPKVVAPNTRANHLWTSETGSASSFVSQLTPAQAVDNFSAQMKTQGWKVISRIAGPASAVVTYVNGKAQSCAITLYRAGRVPNTYVATMSVF